MRTVVCLALIAALSLALVAGGCSDDSGGSTDEAQRRGGRAAALQILLGD